MSKEDARRLRFLIRVHELLEERRRERGLTTVEEAYRQRLGALVPTMRLFLAVAALPADD